MRITGFGLLESLVALVMIASAGLALFSWINTNLDAATRLRERDEVRQLQAAALAFAQTLNPLRQPQGEAELGPGWRLRWQSRTIAPLAAVAPLPGGTSTPFRVQLFELELQLLAGDRLLPQRLTVTRMGAERDPVTAPQPGSP